MVREHTLRALRSALLAFRDDAHKDEIESLTIQNCWIFCNVDTFGKQAVRDVKGRCKGVEVFHWAGRDVESKDAFTVLNELCGYLAYRYVDSMNARSQRKSPAPQAKSSATVSGVSLTAPLIASADFAARGLTSSLCITSRPGPLKNAMLS
jgi:hypothetical protein